MYRSNVILLCLLKYLVNFGGGFTIYGDGQNHVCKLIYRGEHPNMAISVNPSSI
jgi:hypothetical protein